MDGWLAAGVPLLLGAVFMTVGVTIRRGTRRLREQGANARGTVVGFRTRRDFDSNSTMYRPVVQWVTGDGRTVEVVSSTARNTVGDLHRGAAVTVFYDPDDPERMLIDGYDGGVLAGVFCLLGAVGLAAALLVVWCLAT
ncbi:DUF3592 domain-containing protein [Streptomyces sp. NBC_00820]|uniref:DUF3592 domain-containing protein n=1 Tax=Streptomyces sp. NBC_00820 TaxID=2975842 RepID=UPI002ED25E63|nr:DUF3592 domain-containing protein [Streptomyces sp. NBC_00820]